MNRFFSTIAVLAMVLAADLLFLQQTIAGGGLFADPASTELVAVEIAVGFGIIALGFFLIRRRFFRSSSLKRALPVPTVSPLRRLLSAVWS